MTFRHSSERGGAQRGRFERLAEAASNFTSSPVFYALCILLVGAFAGVHLAGLSLGWQHVVGDAVSAVTLLLLALLKNAERRAEHAVQRKLDAIAAALLEQFEGETGEAEPSRWPGCGPAAVDRTPSAGRRQRSRQENVWRAAQANWRMAECRAPFCPSSGPAPSSPRYRARAPH